MSVLIAKIPATVPLANDDTPLASPLVVAPMAPAASPLAGTYATLSGILDGRPCSFDVEFRTFSSGSKGYGFSGKLTGSDGRRYQASVNIVLIGSKPV